MQLEGSFYTIDRFGQEPDGSYTAEATLNPRHPIYEGHFPGHAVVPGVCTLTIIKEFLGKILSKKATFAHIKECKYLSALLPCDELTLTIRITLDGPKVKATVERNDNRQIALKLRAELQP